MIKKLCFSNFYSFAEESCLSFVMGKKPLPSAYDIPLSDGNRLNKVVAVVGSNGSGKTQFIKPLAFLRWLVCDSFLRTDPDEKIPYLPHLFQEQDETELSLEFVLDGQDYRYQLKLKQREVESEILSKRSSGKYAFVFKREKAANSFRFKQQGFPFSQAQAEKIRPNTSLIAAAFSYDVAEARPLVDYFSHIYSNVTLSGRRHFKSQDMLRVAQFYAEEPELRDRMVEALQSFDLGLNHIHLERHEQLTEDGTTDVSYIPYGEHQSSEGDSFKLPFFFESSGTQSAFVLLYPILNALQHGGIAVIDEIDNDLHPHLVPVILEWFRFEHTNPHQAQLLFTCHTPELLNRLQKHQVYLCEKYNQQSYAWRLDEVKGLRADDNLYAKYMAGALGAVPEV